MFTDTQLLKNLVQKTDERFSLTINNLGCQIKSNSVLVVDQHIVIQFILLFKDNDFCEKYINAMSTVKVKKNSQVWINVLDEKEQCVFPFEIITWQITSSRNIVVLTSHYTTWYDDFSFLEKLDSNSIVDYDVPDLFLKTTENSCLIVNVKFDVH